MWKDTRASGESLADRPAVESESAQGRGSKRASARHSEGAPRHVGLEFTRAHIGGGAGGGASAKAGGGTGMEGEVRDEGSEGQTRTQRRDE